MIHTGTGRYEEAIQNLQKALALDPINSDAFRELAKTYQQMGRLKDAESTYMNAIAVRPGYWGTYNDLGGFFYRLGRHEKAEIAFMSPPSGPGGSRSPPNHSTLPARVCERHAGFCVASPRLSRSPAA